MENTNPDDAMTVNSTVDHDSETRETGVSAADLLRANTRVAARLGDVACDGRDSVPTTRELEY